MSVTVIKAIDEKEKTEKEEDGEFFKSVRSSLRTDGWMDGSTTRVGGVLRHGEDDEAKGFDGKSAALALLSSLNPSNIYEGGWIGEDEALATAICLMDALIFTFYYF